MAHVRVQQLDFAELNGWLDEDHEAALRVFRQTCRAIRETELVPKSDWAAVDAAVSDDARGYFETHFRPLMFLDDARPFLTGYYEPEILGSRIPSTRFSSPLYRLPTDMPADQPWPTRAKIEAGALRDKGLELVWVADPVEAFFLQVQGSGRIRLVEGGVMRVGYAGRNHHEYRSVGQELVRRGLIDADGISAQAIKKWVRANGAGGQKLLHHNPSFVFFLEAGDASPDDGPIGTLGHPVTPLRSIAVDPAIIPLGAPVWTEAADFAGKPLHRLMVAQDTGSAIKGAQRADIFCGTGDAAGEIAGALRSDGHLITLLPLVTALRIGGQM